MARSLIKSVFLDSNVIFSGLHSRLGLPAQLLRLCVTGRLRAIVSEMVLEEVMANVRIKMPSRIDDLVAFLSDAGLSVTPDPSHSEIAEVARFVNWDDAPIVAAALASGVDCFVTGDKRLSRELQAMPKSIPTYSPRELIDALDAEERV